MNMGANSHEKRAPGQVLGPGTACWSILLLVFFGLGGPAVLAAGKGGGKGGGTRIAAQISLDDTHPSGADNRIVGDGGPYRDGEDRVQGWVSKDTDIYLSLNATQFKKPPIRHLLLNGVFPDSLACEAVSPGCAPVGVECTDLRPFLLTEVVGWGYFQISGANHDDTPPGVERRVNARWVFRDDAGLLWAVHFGPRPTYTYYFPPGFQAAPCGSCLVVERLENTDAGLSRWRFWTEPQGENANLHQSYLYLVDDEGVSRFAGIVNLPLSGTIESLAAQPQPSGEGYTIPEDPAECPLP